MGPVSALFTPKPGYCSTLISIVHQLYRLADWPDGDRSSRLVFIVQGLDAQRLRESLLGFLASTAVPAATAAGGAP